MRIELFRGENGNWYFHFVAANGEIVASSEGYANQHDAYYAAALVRDGFATVEIETRG